MFRKVALLFCIITFCNGLVLDPFSDAMVDYINNVVKPSWKAGKQIRFKSVEAFKAQLGGKSKKRISRPNKVVPLEEIENDAGLPEEFDARVHWHHCPSIKQIRDQSVCGSCWAFAAVTAMSDRTCIHSQGRLTPTLSAEELLSCCEDCGYGCQGGFSLNAWQYWVKQGLVTGGEYGEKNACQPYVFPHCSHHEKGPYPSCGAIEPTPKCAKRCQVGYHKQFEGDKHYGKSAYNVDRKDIRREIYENGPVEALFEVHMDFPLYKSGVYEPTVKQVEGGHDVRVIGWGVENGVKYWLATNSWNPYWGDNGLFKIKRGEDTCGFESNVVAGMPSV